MKKGRQRTPSDLRRAAEKRLPRPKPARGARAAAEPRRLVHELEVHQVELELQNEELRAARQETEHNLERYTLLFDFAPVGYAILSADGRIREINHVGASLLGRSRSQTVGTLFEKFVAPSDRTAFALVFVETLERETKEACDLSLVKRGEVPLVARVTARALSRGERMLLLAFEDVTERRQREEAQARAEQALREADRRKDEFLAALSHELRNPLAPIRNSLYLLGRAETGDEKVERARAIIDRQVRQLTRLVDDLLDVTRIARGKIQLQREVLELGALVRRTLDDHRASFEESGLRLEPRLDPRTFWIDVDGARVVQALGNVLANAEKFTPRGGTVLVSLQAAPRGEVVLRVTDTGIGIERDVISHVFEPFVQAPQTMERGRGGLGLGLSMVKGLVELHGGTVTVASEGRNRGTEVALRLPLVDPPSEDAAGAVARAARRARRVLVIDDNADNADSLQVGLELSGHEVAIAHDGKTGLELARRFRPDVVISDIGLPGMDGFELARAFRADESLKDTYLVAVSGYARREDLERGASAGFNRYFGKPVRLEELDSVVSEAPVTSTTDAAPPEAAPFQLH
ncbi:MAG TPA: ATP-binding protein [Polyangia bacterium]|nr:ATP-binding protein [Polyangia bacterium]